MRKHISNEYVQVVREMCKQMIYLTDYSPKWNHITVGGYFNKSPNYAHTPYACVFVKGARPGQLEELVSCCNPTKAIYHAGGDSPLKPSYSDKELLEAVEVVTGDFCNLYSKRIRVFSPNETQAP